jgi:hypothetical protein
VFRYRARSPNNNVSPTASPPLRASSPHKPKKLEDLTTHKVALMAVRGANPDGTTILITTGPTMQQLFSSPEEAL